MMPKTKYPYIVRKVIDITTYGDGHVEYKPYVILKDDWFLWPTNNRYGVDDGSSFVTYFLSAHEAYNVSFDSEEKAISALNNAIDYHFRDLLSKEVVSHVEKHI